MAGTSESGGGNDDALAAYTSPRVESERVEAEPRLGVLAYVRAVVSFLVVSVLGGGAILLLGILGLSALLPILGERFFLLFFLYFLVAVLGLVGGLVLGVISAWESLRESRKALEKGRREFE